MTISFTKKITGTKITILREQFSMRDKSHLLTQIKLIKRADDQSRIRRNVDNMFVKNSSATLLKRIRRQTDIVTNGKSY